MTIKSVESFEIHCNGCDTRLEDGDFSIFGNGWDVEELVDNAEWLAVPPDQHYCPQCWVYGDEDEDGDISRIPKEKS
jgi:hypothetical protein